MYNFHTFQNIPPKCLNQQFSTIYMVEIYDYGLSDILNSRLCNIYILNVSLRFIYHLKSKIVPHLHFRCNFTVHLINLRLRPICIANINLRPIYHTKSKITLNLQFKSKFTLYLQCLIQTHDISFTLGAVHKSR